MSAILQINEIENKFESYRKRINKKNGEKLSEIYRGYRWNDVLPPLNLQQGLPFAPVAYRYCDSDRYVYLKKIKCISDTAPTNYKRERGRIIHDYLMTYIDDARKFIELATDLNQFDILKKLKQNKINVLRSVQKKLEDENKLDPTQIQKLISEFKPILNYEESLISARVNYFISKSSSPSKSSLLSYVLPLVMEPELKEIKNMGFTEGVTPDFVLPEERAIGDMKTFLYPATAQFYKLAMTAYALAYERQFRKKIDLGFLFSCVPSTRNIPLIELNVFVIDDVLRKNFIQIRNDVAKIVESKTRPKIASSCPKSCPYLTTCNPGARRIDSTR